MKNKRARRRVDDVPKLEIFDVSYCLCYLMVLNGSQIVMPQHRIKVMFFCNLSSRIARICF